MIQSSRILKSKWLIATIGIIVGILAVLLIRFFTYTPDLTHYHANFAVYINGERQTFQGSKYYEETAEMACTLEQVDTPAERAHMHDNISDVVHVEDKLVTWGNFLQNLGWGLGDSYIATDRTVFNASEDATLVFIVNGQTMKSIANRVIEDEDRVLMSYGTSTSAEAQKQFDAIDSTANAFDTKKDPAGCSGSRPVTNQDRLNHLFN
jgi:hypothetical protein